MIDNKAALPATSPTPRSSQDKQFEENRRIAEHIIQALRQAGYSCDLTIDAHPRELKRDH
jgi:hypothetical protein